MNSACLHWYSLHSVPRTWFRTLRQGFLQTFEISLLSEAF